MTVQKYLGIDLGTKNTTVAVWDDPPSILRLEEGEVSVPSCLIPFEGEWLYGSMALQVCETGEGGIINIRQEQPLQ